MRFLKQKYYGYDDKGTEGTEDDDHLYFIRWYVLKDKEGRNASSGEVWLYDPDLQFVKRWDVRELQCLEHESQDGLVASVDGVKHGILVPVPVNLMEKAGTYYFVLHFEDDHADKYKDHQVKPALEMNAKEDIPYHIKSVTWEALASSEGGSLEADRPSRLHSPLAHWQRIFPDRQSPNDPHQSTRRQVLVKIQIDPPLKDKQVWLRSFDVDDPSSPHDQYDPNAIIDPKDSVNLDLPNEGDEGDNRGTPKTGRFIGAVDTSVEFIDERTIKVLTGEGGIAKIIFEVTMQPGDNFRIVATTDQNQFLNLAARKRVKDGSIWFVKKDAQGKVRKWVGKVNDDTTRPMKTKASPVLTVWRRLWVEVDSMGSPPAGIQLGEDDLTTADIPDPPLDALTEAMKDAYVEVFKMPQGYNEFATSWKYVFIAGGQGDDDIINYARNHCQSRNLRSTDFWVVYIIGIYEIGLVSFQPEYFSPVRETDDPNDPAPIDPDPDDRDNDPDIWYHTDGTPRGETAINGITDPEGYSFVAYEQIRDICVQRRFQNPNERRQMNINQIYAGTVAHEIGHHFDLEHTNTPEPRDLMWAPGPRFLKGGGGEDDSEEEMLQQRPWRWKPDDIDRIRKTQCP